MSQPKQQSQSQAGEIPEGLLKSYYEVREKITKPKVPMEAAHRDELLRLLGAIDELVQLHGTTTGEMRDLLRARIIGRMNELREACQEFNLVNLAHLLSDSEAGGPTNPQPGKKN